MLARGGADRSELRRGEDHRELAWRGVGPADRIGERRQPRALPSGGRRRRDRISVRLQGAADTTLEWTVRARFVRTRPIAFIAFLASCSDRELPPRSQLVLTVDTDAPLAL